MNEILSYDSMHLESSLFSWFVSLLNASHFLQLIRQLCDVAKSAEDLEKSAGNSFFTC